MKPIKMFLPLLAAAAFALVVPGPRAQGFKLTGESLRLTHRDVRVHNNFTDPEANSNGSAHPSFPGYTGAELAIWKGCLEWGSELHFEGQGDATQPGDLGSGGANFDSSWQGNAGDPGGPSDNVHSELGGFGGGVIAFTETPTSDGWRIRYYRNPWTFYDHPDFPPNGPQAVDLQGVACHEYGHALGLDHSNKAGATMFPNTTQFAGDWRSIEDDDRTGIQAIYGARDPSKPHVASYTHLASSLLELQGSDFAPAGNEVWFTRAGGGDGTPVKVTGLAASQGGTRLVLQVPALAGPGDLLVNRPGPGFETISNAFPFDPGANPCPTPLAYGTGKVNSSGVEARIGWSGFPSHSAADFKVTLSGGPPGEWGLVFWGAGQQATPFKGGWMLVAPPRQRGRRFSIDTFGFGKAPVLIDASMIGQTRYLQLWYRDVLDPWGAGTSDALQVTFCE